MPILPFASVAALVALLVRLAFYAVPAGDALLFTNFAICAPFSAALATLLIWTRERGALAGAAIALAAYPFSWLLLSCGYWLYSSTQLSDFRHHDLYRDPGHELFRIGGLIIFSWAYTGWFAAPIGALLGWWLGRRPALVRGAANCHTAAEGCET